MDLARLRRGELIAGVSGLALFVIMFFGWFGASAEVPGFEVGVTFSAWESFDFIDLILLLTVVVAVGLAAATAASQTVALPVAASAITAGLGILSTLLVLYRIIDPPHELGREFGVFLGLIASAGIALGGWLSMQEEGTTFSGAADQARDRFGGSGGGGGDTAPAAPPPAAEPPPAEGAGGTPPSSPPPSAPPPSTRQ
jgi:hypothetical protein